MNPKSPGDQGQLPKHRFPTRKETDPKGQNGTTIGTQTPDPSWQHPSQTGNRPFMPKQGSLVYTAVKVSPCKAVSLGFQAHRSPSKIYEGEGGGGEIRRP